MSAQIRDLIESVVRKHYELTDDPVNIDGTQLWRGKWYSPVEGCDTLEAIVDDLVYAIERY
jgi:hypothetical protein